MSMYDAEFCRVRVFSPQYTLIRAGGGGECPELLSMLNCLYSPREKETPIANAPFYRYGRYVAVVTEHDGSLYCCTYVDEECHEVYDMQREGEQIRAFFEQADGDLTVLDNEHFSELIPQYDVVERYVSGRRQVIEAYDRHRAEIDGYERELDRFKDILTESSGQDSDNLSVRLRELLQLNLRMMGAVAQDVRDISERELLSCYRPLPAPAVNLFGLYVGIMWHGIARGRFMRHRSRVMSSVYREAMKEMHAFMQANEGVVERYCEAMRFPACEREMLIKDLEDEGLYGDKWIRIGDDYFG